MIERLAAERESRRASERPAYDLLIGSISDKVRHITVIHKRFMEHVDDILNGLDRLRGSAGRRRGHLAALVPCNNSC
jgi:hypothetical protein